MLFSLSVVLLSSSSAIANNLRTVEWTKSRFSDFIFRWLSPSPDLYWTNSTLPNLPPAAWLALGDVDANRSTGVVTATTAGQFDVWAAPSSKEFKKSATVEIPNFKITNAVVVDWTASGVPGLIVTGTTKDDEHQQQHEKIVIFGFVREAGKYRNIWRSDEFCGDCEILSHPVVGDITGDGTVDLLLQTSQGRTLWSGNGNKSFDPISWDSIFKGAGEAKQNSRKLWEWPFGWKREVVTTTSAPTQTRFSIWSDDDERSPPGTSPIHPRQTSAFVDLDGDCCADLILEVQAYNRSSADRELEFWLCRRDDKGKFYFKFWRPSNGKSIVLPEGSGALAWSDFDGDGSVDFAFPHCALDANGRCTDESAIVVSENLQIPLCREVYGIFTPSSWGRDCRPSNDLCRAVDFDFADPKIFKLPNGRQFAPPVNGLVALRTADIDTDGFVDLVVPTVTASTTELSIFMNRRLADHVIQSSPNVTAPMLSQINLLMSQIGSLLSPQTPTADESTVGRTFVVSWSFEIGTKKGIGVDAAIIDLFDDGLLDVVAIGSSGTFPFLFSQSRAGIDAAYLKTWALGVHTGGTSSLVGVPTKIALTDRSGVKKSFAATQMSQTSHVSLQLPYSYFGLLRTSTFIDEFYAGLPTANVDHPTQCAYRRWTSLIPNSQVFVLLDSRVAPDRWRLQLAVSPSHAFWGVVSATGVCLTLIGIVIVALDRKDEFEDVKEMTGFRRQFILA